jgi:hypothetical protein
MGYATKNPVSPSVMPTTQNKVALQKIFHRSRAVKFVILH